MFATRAVRGWRVRGLGRRPAWYERSGSRVREVTGRAARGAVRFVVEHPIWTSLLATTGVAAYLAGTRVWRRVTG